MNLKYDSWHKEVLSKFGQMLGQNMQDFHAQISKVTYGFTNIVAWITYIQGNSYSGQMTHALLFLISPVKISNNILWTRLVLQMLSTS